MEFVIYFIIIFSLSNFFYIIFNGKNEKKKCLISLVVVVILTLLYYFLFDNSTMKIDKIINPFIPPVFFTLTYGIHFLIRKTKLGNNYFGHLLLFFIFSFFLVAILTTLVSSLY